MKFYLYLVDLSNLTGVGRVFEHCLDESSEIILSSNLAHYQLIYFGLNKHSLCSLKYDRPWLYNQLTFLALCCVSREASCHVSFTKSSSLNKRMPPKMHLLQQVTKVLNFHCIYLIETC